MERFYSIRKSLNAAQNHLTRCQQFSFTDEDANELLNLLHFLKPLVDGINYCQNNSHTQIDLLPLIESIQKYYRESINHPVGYFLCYCFVEFAFPFAERIGKIFREIRLIQMYTKTSCPVI